MKHPRRIVRGTAYIPVADPAHPDIGYGVLRRRLDDVTNDLRVFVQTKLQPMKLKTASAPWSRTCWRDDVLLPVGAGDDMCDVRAVCERFEASATTDTKNLAVLITIRLRGGDPMHVSWEKVRGFAHERLAIQRKMAVILVGHVPAHAGSRAGNHIHLVASARELGPNGFDAPVPLLTSDRGLPIVGAEWAAWS